MVGFSERNDMVGVSWDVGHEEDWLSIRVDCRNNGH